MCKTLQSFRAYIIVLLCSLATAQIGSSTQSSVPQLVKFSGTAVDEQGKPVSGIIGLTFAIYNAQQGGSPLWLETQNVATDAKGNYSVQLGSTQPDGLPLALFSSGEARWLGVRVNGGEEQPRVLLLSVPYALKAADAQTLGGLPASAFVLATPPVAGATAPASNSDSNLSSSAAPPPSASDVTTSGGTANALPLFTTATNVQNSILTQTGTTAINVGGKLNLPTTGTATATKGFVSRPLDFAASSFNSSSAVPVPEVFQWQAEPANNNTANPSAVMSLLYGFGTNAPAETGFRVSSKGIIGFAAGQTFPGTGSIAGVTAGTALTGGGTSGNVTLSLNTAKVPLLASNNAFTATNTFGGKVGIGTTSPTENLQVVGTSPVLSLTGSGIPSFQVLSASGGDDYRLESNRASTGEFSISDCSAGCVERLTVLKSGSIGIGTTPLANLDVIGGGGLHTLVGDPGCGTFAAIGFLTTPLSGCANYALLGDASGGTYLNASGSSQTIHFRVNNTDEVMDILPNTVLVSGQMGMGTSSPGAILDVETAGPGMAGYFQNDSDNTFIPALGAVNTVPESDEFGYAFIAGGNFSSEGCGMDKHGNLTCAGSKSAVVPVDGGARRVALYAVEAPENWFEDYGSGQLSNGSARIVLEPTFAQTVNTDLDYHVFLTPNGDCKGLYVTQKSPTSFEVHELGGGTASIAFDYRIIAKRKNYENIRLADYTERFRKLDEQFAKMRQRKPAKAPAALSTASALQQRTAMNSGKAK